MITLGIESTAHTFGIGIVEDGKIIANKKAVLKKEKEGFLPRELVQHHAKIAAQTIKEALAEAKLNFADIDRIAYSRGPGFEGSLELARNIAYLLHKKYNTEIKGVNHLLAHLEIGKKDSGMKKPIFIFSSGANTFICGIKGKKYRIFGETLDMGIGNAIDRFGRLLGIGFPAGPILDEIYFQGKNYIPLPYSVKGMDLTFSGILSAVEKKINEKKHKKEDIVFSFLHTIFAMLTEVTERALALNYEGVILVGGVAASKALTQMLRTMTKERGVQFYVPPEELRGDNGAMIAYLGSLYEKGDSGWKEVLPYWRLENTVLPKSILI